MIDFSDNTLYYLLNYTSNYITAFTTIASILQLITVVCTRYRNGIGLPTHITFDMQNTYY